MSNYVNDALLDASPYKKQQEEAKALVNKWDKTGLLDGLNEDFQKSGMAVMLENQAKQLINENSATGGGAGSGTAGTAGSEEWSGVALPLVRRIFGEIAAQDFVSVQPMNLPSGLVFYLDFKYGESNLGKTAGRSLGGTTGANTPASGRDAHGTGGLYGAGAFGYSQNSASKGLALSQSLEADTNGATAAQVGAVSASFEEITGASSNFNQNTELSASIAAVAAQKLTKIGVDYSETLTNPDLLAVRSWQVKSTEFTELDTLDVNQLNYVDATNGIAYLYVHTATNHPTADDAITIEYTKAPTEADRGDFESTSGKNMEIPEVDLQLNSSAIVAKTRKLKAVWTPELAQDLNAYHSVDAEAELTSMLSEYISMEIDLEILDMLISDATTVDYWSAKVGRHYNSSTTEWWQTLAAKVQKVSNEIHRLTLRGGANFMVVSPKIATILESLPGYNSTSENAASKFAMGVSQIGSIDSRFSVYKNPYMTENTILVGFRGSNFLETGAVYAPYVPLIMTPLVYDPTDFTPRKGVMTRYAKKMIRPEFYGKIYVKGLENL